MGVPTILNRSEFIRRHVAATLATARGEAPPYLFGMQPRPDRLLCVLDAGAGPVGAIIPGDFEALDPRSGYVDQAAARALFIYAAARADEDESTAAFAEAVAANWQEISALYRTMFKPSSDPVIRRFEELFGLADPAEPTTH